MLSRCLIKTSTRFLGQHPLQTGLTLLGVMLGVAIVVAVDLANTSARRALDLSLEMTNGSATHHIKGDASGIPEDVYRRLRTELGLEASAPLVSDEVRHGEERLTLLGLDIFAHDFARPVHQPELSAEQGRRLLLEPDTVAMAEQTAARLGVQTGDRLQLDYRGASREVTVAHVFTSGHPASAGLLLADIAVAQELLGRVGVLDRIDLELPDEKAVHQLQDWLPPGLSLEAADSQRQTLSGMTRSFHINLAAMSLLALLVGGFLIFNTMTFAVLRRRDQFGTLRALGVSRRELIALTLAEALAVGTLATVAGLVAGIGLGQLLIELVTVTINDLYYRTHISQLFVSPVALARGLLLGLATTAVAAWLPVLDAARVAPLTLGQRSDVEKRGIALFIKLALAGLLLMLAGLLLTGIPSRSLSLGFVALAMVIIGFSLTVPILTRGLCTLASALAAKGPLLLRFGIRGISDGLSRTGPAIAALTLAIATTLGVGIMISSFRQTVVDWLDQTLEADIFVSIPGRMPEHRDNGLPQALVARLRQHPGVARTSASRMLRVTSEAGPVRLMAVETDPEQNRNFRLKAGNPESSRRAFQQSRGVLIAEPLAWHRELRVGDQLSLVTPDGPVSLPVLGIFYDYTSGSGLVLMNLQQYQTLWRDPGISSVGLFAGAGVDIPALTTEIGDLVRPYGATLQVRASHEIRTISLEVFDRTFTVTEVLRLLSIVVAFVGVLTALLALQLEKTREYALLRATGVTPVQVRILVLGQTLVIGLIAGLLALPLGYLMSTLLIDVINLRSFGWSLQTVVPAAGLIQALTVALFAALLAGIYPALRAGRLAVAAALRGE